MIWSGKMESGAKSKKFYTINLKKAVSIFRSAPIYPVIKKDDEIKKDIRKDKS